MNSGQYLLELAGHIPARNINFYLDAYQAMDAVNQREADGFGTIEIQKIKDRIADHGLEAQPVKALDLLLSTRNTCSEIKAIGKLLLSELRLGKFTERVESVATLPWTFLTYVVTADLELHGYGPCYSFVERFIDELSREKIINNNSQRSDIPRHVAEYIHEDMASIFLGYSLLSGGTLTCLVPFPAGKTGFTAKLFHDIQKLLPQVQ